MAIDFSALKKQSSLASLEKLNKKESYGKENYWKPSFDAKGNSSSIIRFLPAPKGEEDSIVQLYQHGFKVGDRWFIENCPTTVGEKCPVCL